MEYCAKGDLRSLIDDAISNRCSASTTCTHSRDQM
jgi:hypothetical protein